MKKHRVQESRKGVNILKNRIKAITKERKSCILLNDKITKIKEYQNNYFNLFFYHFLLLRKNLVISN